MSLAAKLRIGIALDSTIVPSWQAKLLKSLHDLECAEVSLVIFCSARAGSVRSIGRPPLGLGGLCRLLRRIDGAKRDAAPDALACETLMHLSGWLGHVELAGNGGTNSLETEIRSANLDVLVSLVDIDAVAGFCALIRMGVWYFDAGGTKMLPPDGSTVGVSEVLRGATSLTGLLRVRARGSGNDLVAYQTCSAVHASSHHLTRNEHLWKCSAFVARALRRCHSMGVDNYLRSLPPAPNCIPRSRFAPLALALCTYLGRRLRQKAIRKRFAERWILLRGKADTNFDPCEFVPLVPPAGRFWADPHVVVHEGVEHIFFEDASSATGRGHISVMSSNPDGTFSLPTPIIRRPYHLSYPFVFLWQGEYFMIPESAENHTIELFRCTRFPDEWEYSHNLMDGIRAYDATLVDFGGRWWMFANVADVKGASSWDELCVFHAESPISRDWQPHIGNPVLSDVRCARPAGPFFWDGRRLIRPSQDSSGRYGRALRFNEVVVLSENAYLESTIRAIEPDWGPEFVAVHSHSRAGTTALIDAIRRETR